MKGNLMGTLHELARPHRPNPYQVSEEILYRWSPRVMNGETLTETELLPLLEAARYAPSARNAQGWRFYYVTRQDERFNDLFCLLSESNRAWCKKAGALVILVSQRLYEGGTRTHRSHSLDAGMAYQNFAIEGTRRDLVVHPLGAFDRPAAQALLGLGEDFHLEIMIAVGKPGEVQALAADRVPPERKNVAEIAFRLDGLAEPPFLME
jgi:nitroreductase